VRHLSWIITVPVALLAISFAITNRAGVELGLWPLPFRVQAPLYVLVLGALAFGFLFGGLVAWLAQMHWRRTARQQRRRLEQLATEVKEWREKQAATDAAAARASAAARVHAEAGAAGRVALADRSAPPAPRT
jgi:uncharacterized integral membrane protein